MSNVFPVARRNANTPPHNTMTTTASTISAPASTKFAVVWFSPRGFANEGSYFYGTETEMEQLHEAYDPTASGYSYQSGHLTLAAAEAKAVKLARRACSETPSHELCCIKAAPFSDYLS